MDKVQADPTLKAEYEAAKKELAIVKKAIYEMEETTKADPQFRKLHEERNVILRRLRGYGYTLDGEAESRERKSIQDERDAERARLASPFISTGENNWTEPTYYTDQYAVGIQTNIRDRVFEAMKEAGYPKSKLRFSTIVEFVEALINKNIKEHDQKLKALDEEQERLEAEEEKFNDLLAKIENPPKLEKLRVRHAELFTRIRKLEEPVLKPEVVATRQDREVANSNIMSKVDDVFYRVVGE